MISTKYNNSYSDFVAKKVLKNQGKFKIYPFKYCGSDERQYNFPGINIPVVTLTKTKFGIYKEYHTSLDNLKITNSKTLKKSYNLLVSIIEEINKDVSKKYKNSSLINDKMLTKKLPKKYNLKVISRTKCEPFMSKRNLYRDLSKDLLTKDEFLMFNLLYYGDGIKIKDISNIVGFDPSLVFNKAVFLEKHKLIHLKK